MHKFDAHYAGVRLTESGVSCSRASLDADNCRDLKIQLKKKETFISEKYSLYVSCIHESLEAEGVSAKALCSALMNFSAFNHSKQMVILVSAHKAELEKAIDLHGIFSILTTEYASFLNYDIFCYIVRKYQIDHGQEELKYREHLNAYLESLSAAEFVEINPLLKEYSSTSKECVLKIDTESTVRLAKIIDLQTAITEILGLKSSALQLLDIKDGCVVVTFLTPTPVAELVFTEHTVLTEEQKRRFRALSVLWLRCNNRTFNFAVKADQNVDK